MVQILYGNKLFDMTRKLNKSKKVVKKTTKSTNKPVKEKVFLKLDLGCGDNKAQGYLGVDYVKTPSVDIVHDLTVFPYPFKDESVEEIFSSHFIEHLDGFTRAKFFEECHRILIKPQKDEYGNITKVGKMRVIHPYAKSVRAVQDFTHKWPPICEQSYLYWNKGWREANKLTHGYYDLKCDFDFNISYTFQDGTISQRNQETQQFWADKYWNVIADLIVDLTKK